MCPPPATPCPSSQCLGPLLATCSPFVATWGLHHDAWVPFWPLGSLVPTPCPPPGHLGPLAATQVPLSHHLDPLFPTPRPLWVQAGRAGGRWKESPRRSNANALQDAVLAARLREAQAQAELRALRQRVLQLETQVGVNWAYWGHWC